MNNATKEYAKQIGKIVGPSSINNVTFGKEVKRIKGEWDVRWVWSMDISKEHKDETVGCRWEGFKTLPSCLNDLDRNIKAITAKSPVKLVNS